MDATLEANHAAAASDVYPWRFFAFVVGNG